MKINKEIFIILVVFSTLSLESQYFDFGMGYSPRMTPDRKEEKKTEIKEDPYIRQIVTALNQKYDEVYLLHKRGYGRNELIKLIMISISAKKELKDVIEKRDSKMKISDIAKHYNIEYNNLRKGAEELFLSIKQGVSENKILFSTITVDYTIYSSTKSKDTQETLNGSTSTIKIQGDEK